MSEQLPVTALRTRFVVDTSVFTNPETRELLGTDVQEALRRFLDIARKHGLQIYMPLSIFRELSNFATADALAEVRRDVIVRGPDLYNIQVPAAIFHTFIKELRQRVNKGLVIAEKAIHTEDVPENVRWVRHHYRDALRSGIVDSAEDFDVVILAKEIDAVVISEDQGIANMAQELGLEVFTGEEFVSYSLKPREEASDQHG